MYHRFALIVFCILAFTPPAHAATIDRTIDVVFVEMPGETFTAERQTDALARLNNAIAWWVDVSPAPLALHIEQTYFVHVISNTQTLADSGISIQSSRIVLHIIDTTNTRFTFEGAQGKTVLWPGESEYTYITTAATEAQIAHELGHAVYHLPDWYLTPEKCGGVDLMCLTSQQAYASRFIGCQSLGELGEPCTRVYLPLVATSPQSPKTP